VVKFSCTACEGRRTGDMVAVDEETRGVIREVKQFCYLGDMLDSEGRVERSVRKRVAGAWKKWREIGGLLINKGIPLSYRGKVYEACIRSVLLYGLKTWSLTKNVQDVLIGCDRRMLSYMTGVTWGD
jgi:hypothetical protein